MLQLLLTITGGKSTTDYFVWTNMRLRDQLYRLGCTWGCHKLWTLMIRSLTVKSVWHPMYIHLLSVDAITNPSTKPSSVRAELQQLALGGTLSWPFRHFNVTTPSLLTSRPSYVRLINIIQEANKPRASKYTGKTLSIHLNWAWYTFLLFHHALARKTM